MFRSPTDGIYYLRPDDGVQRPTPPGQQDPSSIHGDPGERDRGVPLTKLYGRGFAVRHITNWMGTAAGSTKISWSIMDPRAHWGYGKYMVKNPRAVRYLNQVPFMKGKYVNEHGLVKNIALVKSYVTDKYVRDGKFVPIHKWPICPISALHEKFNPRNINHMPAVKFSVRLDLDQICLFPDGHKFEVKLVWWIENFEGDIWEEGGAAVRLPSNYAPNR